MRTMLVLHGVRLLGFAAPGAVASRFLLDIEATREELLDQEAAGRVTWSEFAGSAGWSLTERGVGENERLLAIQLDAHPGARRVVERGHEAFLPLNSRLRGACTDWQLRPSPSEPLAANDHTDADWDAGILIELADIASELQSLEMALVGALRRFGGYHRRFAQALDHRRIDDSDQDSCHRVWFELHEDLNATLGISRG